MEDLPVNEIYGIRYITDGKVYAPREDTFLVLKNLRLGGDEEVLELGTGSGVIAIYAAKKARRVVATDIDSHAIEIARSNAQLNEVEIDLRTGDLFDPVGNETFDVIVFNPPYLPSSEETDELKITWDGGRDGREITDRFLRLFNRYLNENGRCYLVQSSLCRPEMTEEVIRERGFEAEIVDRDRFCFEEIMLYKISR